MTHSIGSKPLLLKNFNLHEILNYSAKFSSATGNRSVAANISKGLKLFDDKFVSKISFTEPDFLMNDDFFIQGFVKAEMKKKVTYKPCVQIRTACQDSLHFTSKKPPKCIDAKVASPIKRFTARQRNLASSSIVITSPRRQPLHIRRRDVWSGTPSKRPSSLRVGWRVPPYALIIS
ncbi:hypothetical protein TNCV_4450421 [Trichonephila clavipes]|nr:hypothetical protein TNCV_4450421 [Trichonephila clavipes]